MSKIHSRNQSDLIVYRMSRIWYVLPGDGEAMSKSLKKIGVPREYRVMREKRNHEGL